LNYDLPIAHTIYEILWQGQNPALAFKNIEKIFN
jgi:hypothetical protein